MKKNTLLWLGLGAAALYLYSKKKSALSGLDALNPIYSCHKNSGIWHNGQCYIPKSICAAALHQGTSPVTPQPVQPNQEQCTSGYRVFSSLDYSASKTGGPILKSSCVPESQCAEIYGVSDSGCGSCCNPNNPIYTPNPTGSGGTITIPGVNA